MKKNWIAPEMINLDLESGTKIGATFEFSVYYS